jgi:Mg-chelatase subunit ChlD
VAGKIYKAGMSLLVIDTENKFVSTGFAKEIARVAQGTPVMANPPNAFGTSFLKYRNTVFPC